MALLRLRCICRYSTSNPHTLHAPLPTSSTPNHNPPYPNFFNSAGNHLPHNPHPPNQFLSPNTQTSHSDSHSAATNNPFVPQRSYGFASAEEAAAERRRRKRRLRIEPPLYALRPDPETPRPNPKPPKSNAPPIPDGTSSLVGPRLNLHNRVQGLIRAGDLDAASYVARQSVYQAVRPTVFTCNAIMSAMCRAKRYDVVKALFQYFFRQFNVIPNVVSYNYLIEAHFESDEIEDALKVYQHILENAPFCPSPGTYSHLTKGLVDAWRVDDALTFLREMLHKGLAADSMVYNNVILGFLNLGNLGKASDLFDELKERCTIYDAAVNATFMDWFFNQGKPREAMESYRDLMTRNFKMVPAMRNVLLETLLRHGKKKEAWSLFNAMLDDHTPPTFLAVNSDTYNVMVNECFKEGKVKEAMEVFKKSGKGLKSKPFQMDVYGFNNMMMRLCELGLLDEAEEYYNELLAKSLYADVNTYRTMIDAYIKVDRVDDMIEKYTKMVEFGLRVISPYACKWFGFMIEKGRVCDCLPILSKMALKEPKPDAKIYEVVVRGLVDNGHYDESSNLLRQIANQGIGITPSLKEHVGGVFERLGRSREFDDILKRLSAPFHLINPT